MALALLVAAPQLSERQLAEAIEQAQGSPAIAHRIEQISRVTSRTRRW